MSLTNQITTLIPTIRSLVRDDLREDGSDPYEYIGDSVFDLSQKNVDSTSIVVYVNQSAIGSNDFSYDSDKNQVTIDYEASGQELSSGDSVIITYDYYLKYSDALITKYVKSSLFYFVQYNYKKVFEVTSNDYIVADNDTNPTLKELNLICGITSIMLDPQNIDVSTPEYSISKLRDKSDQQQIKDVFRCFNRFAGEVTFNNIEPDYNEY